MWARAVGLVEPTAIRNWHRAMTENRPLTLAFVLCCLLVVGSLAGSVTSAIESTPDDAIDVSYDTLPISRGTGEQLKQALGDGTGKPSTMTASPGDGPNKRPADAQESRRQSSAAPDDSGANPAGSNAGAGDDTTQAGGGDSSSGSGSAGSQDLLATLLDLLRRLLSLLVGVVALVSIVVLVRYRDRIASLLDPYLDRLTTALAPYLDRLPGLPWRATQTASSDDRSSLPAATAVEGAWQEMVRRAEVVPGDGTTPRQCVAEAIQTGSIDDDAARELTELFERVRYGGVVETPERARRALVCLREAVDGGES